MKSERAASAELTRAIALAEPEIGGNEWKYVKECLDTRWVSSVGSFVDRFEREFAAFVGTRFAVATMNGTSALHIALLVAEVQPDDEVLVSTLTFIAPANAVRYVGAWPVFIDAELQFWQMDPDKVFDFVTKECRWKHGELRNKTTGRRVRAVLPVHILGHPVDIDPILEVARKYDLVVIEDATEGPGAAYKARKVGALGDIACFSFNGNKLITTGGGGMIVTDNSEWAQKARYLTTQAKDDPVEFIHCEIGYNYRLTNIQAAMGCAQLERVDDFLDAKRRIAEAYHDAFAGIPAITPMPEAPWACSAYWMYTVLLAESIGPAWRPVVEQLGQRGIQSRPLWQPLHRSPAHRGCQAFRCEVAEQIQRRALSLPCSVGLAREDQARVIEVLKVALPARGRRKYSALPL